MFGTTLETAVQGALQALGAGEAAFTVERPRLEHGDYTTNAALAAAKLLKKNPKEVAELLKKDLDGKIEYVEKIEIAGAGFLNFWLTREALAQQVQTAATVGFGANYLHRGKTILVEYTQPNPFKPFHIGHLMSNTLGEALARLFEKSGAQVIRANYQGDVGPHVAKALYVLLKKGATQPSIKEIGAAYAEGNRLYEENPEIKKEIDALNRKVYERSDEGVNALYDYGRKLSLDHFEEIYKKLGTKFDYYFFESETAPRGVAIVKKHTGVFEESDGAVVYRGEHTRVFITSQGLPTYEAKDLGLAEMKKEKAQFFDEAITVTANEQDGYFRVVFDSLAKVHPEWAGQFKHVSHGMMRFASGKMSSRKGNVVTGESLIEELTEVARGREDVAVGAIKYAVLKSGSGKDIVFDPERSLSLEGDSGPYLQYARVRAVSLLQKKPSEVSVGKYVESLNDVHLARVLVHFPDVVARAAKELEPHYLTTYLTELATAFNRWYGGDRLIIEGEILKSRANLIRAVECTLSEGLSILGIPAPEKM